MFYNPDQLFKDGNGVLYDSKNKRILVQCPSSFQGAFNVPDSVTKIHEMAFYNCKGLKLIYIPNSVISIDDRAFDGCEGLTYIEIPNSVTKIGKKVFYGCTELNSVILPNGISSIEESTFEGCSSLPSIELPQSVTNIEKKAFKNCENLHTINIPDCVEQIGDGAFAFCRKLTTINIPDCAKLGDGVFSSCDSLPVYENIRYVGKCLVDVVDKTLYSYDIQEGTTRIITGVFSRCKQLSLMTIPDSVVEIGDRAFSECENLSRIDISDSVTSIGEYAFAGCSSLVKVKLPKDLIEIQEGTFEGCHLSDWSMIPKSIKLIGKRAFAGCNFTKIDLFCSALEDAFVGCPLIYVYIYEGVEEFNYENYCSWTEYDPYDEMLVRNTYFVFFGENLFFTRKPEWDTNGANEYIIDGKNIFVSDCELRFSFGVVEPAAKIFIHQGVANLFRHKKELFFTGDNEDPLHCLLFLKRVTKVGGSVYLNLETPACSREGYYSERECCVPEGVETIEDFKDKEAFSLLLPSTLKNISNDTFAESRYVSLDFPNGNNVECIGDRAFFKCTLDNGVDFSSWKELKSIGKSAFEGSDISSIDLSNTNIRIIQERTFADCKDLEEVILPDTVEVIAEGAFEGCSNLKKIILPNSIKIIKKDTFAGCSSLTSIVLPDPIETIEDSAFYGCEGLNKIIVPKNLKHVGVDAFRDCGSLPVNENIMYAGTCLVGVYDDELSSYYIQLNTRIISDGAFAGCENLTSIYIPNYVHHIGNRAFASCHNLQSVTFSKSIRQIGDGIFDNCPNLREIVVLKGEKERFSKMDGLKEWKDLIVEKEKPLC